MTHLVAIILGFIQGATEFIPISSSGHLIIARQLLGVNDAGGLAFDAVLQLATVLALLVYFWKDIMHIIGVAFAWFMRKPVENKDKTLLYAIFLGTIPAIIFGLLLESYMDSLFRNVRLVAITLILGSVLFWVAQKFSKNSLPRQGLGERESQGQSLTLGKGIVVGFFQCLALVPGISRSGATISGGLLVGLSQEEATRFSFLLSIPILFGAGLKKLLEVRHDLFSTDFGMALLLGSVTAFVVGLISISFLIKYLKTHNLNLFIYYRIALSLAIFLLF